MIPTTLDGVLIIEPQVFTDARGFFLESFNAKRYAEEAGIAGPFVQDNHSRSVLNALRGLHYQLRQPQAKLVRVTRGEAYDVILDVRRGSPTFGRWFGVRLSAANMRQVYIPPGYAHGYCALVDGTELEYKCTAFYAPDDGHGVRWDDPLPAIDWPVEGPILSVMDQSYPPLHPDREDLPLYVES